MIHKIKMKPQTIIVCDFIATDITDIPLSGGFVKEMSGFMCLLLTWADFVREFPG